MVHTDILREKECGMTVLPAVDGKKKKTANSIFDTKTGKSTRCKTRRYQTGEQYFKLLVYGIIKFGGKAKCDKSKYQQYQCTSIQAQHNK